MGKRIINVAGAGALGLAGLLLLGACSADADAGGTTPPAAASVDATQTPPAGAGETAEDASEQETEAAPTVAQANALAAAESYLATMPFSKAGLIHQLSSEYGSQFDKADAKWAVAHLDVDWKEQAVKAGQSYLDTMPFSRAALIEQLTSENGSQFTKAQAVYAVDQLGL